MASFQGLLASIHVQLSYLSSLVTDLQAQHERELARAHRAHGSTAATDRAVTLAFLGPRTPSMSSSAPPPRSKASRASRQMKASYALESMDADSLHPAGGAEDVMEQAVGAGADDGFTAVENPAPRGGLYLDALDNTGTSLELLRDACTMGEDDEVLELLDREADPNVRFGNFTCGGKDFLDGTPLSVAVLRGRHSLVNSLLLHRADVDSTYSFLAGAEQICWTGTAVHATVARGDLQMLEELVRLGADMEAQGTNGASLLWQAAYFGTLKIAEFLIDEGADIEQPAMSQDDLTISHTPLHAAAINGHSAVLGALLKARASPVNDDATGLQPLEDAVQQGHAGVAQLLVAASADLFHTVPADRRSSRCGSQISSVYTASEREPMSGRCIDEVFRSRNPGLIAAVAQGLKDAPSLIDELSNSDLVHFLSTPGEAPLLILDAIFRPCPLVYWDMRGNKLRRARRLAAFIGPKNVNVTGGPHKNSIVELFNRKQVAPPTLLKFLEELAPQSDPSPSQCFVPATFYMCHVPLVQQDLNLLKALADCPVQDVFREPGCQAIVNFKWRSERQWARVHMVLAVLELINLQCICVVLNSPENTSLGSRAEPLLMVANALACIFLFLGSVSELARQLGYISCGLARRYFMNAGAWATKVVLLLIAGVNCTIWRFGTESKSSLVFKVFLGLAILGKWVDVFRTLRQQETIGLRLLPITVTMLEAWPFLILLCAGLCASASFYYALGIHPFAECFVLLLQNALGEMDLDQMERVFPTRMFLPSWAAWTSGSARPEIVQQEPARTENYMIVRVFLVALSFLIGVSMMNLYIAILCRSYVQACDVAWLDFMRCRAKRVLDRQALRYGMAILCCRRREESRGPRNFSGLTSKVMKAKSDGLLPELAADTAYVWFAAEKEFQGDGISERRPQVHGVRALVGPTMSKSTSTPRSIASRGLSGFKGASFNANNVSHF